MNRIRARFAWLLVAGCAWGCGPDGETSRRLHSCPIINGVPDESPEHFSVVGLQMSSGEGIGRCTGTLISRRVVLTAAHCVVGTEPDAVVVYFGNNYSESQTRDVMDVLWHPEYSRSSLRNDIALVRLASDPPIGAVPIPNLPASMAITVNDIGVPLEYVGYGQDEDGNDGVKKTVTNALDWVCTISPGCSLGGGMWAVRNTICSDQDPGGPCQGDSGGPAFVDRDDREYVCGVTSYGDGAGCTIYGCSTKVDEFESFISDFSGGPEGTSCGNDRECLSFQCVDGFCCDRACAGRCEACNLAGLEGTCSPLPDGTLCLDSNLCNGEESCLAGSCEAGDDIVCEDAVECTFDTCDPASGCQFQPMATECDDANLCTRDICDPLTGCLHDPMPEGMACGSCLLCQSGQCADDPACKDEGGCGCAHRRNGAVLLLLFLPLALRRRG